MEQKRMKRAEERERKEKEEASRVAGVENTAEMLIRMVNKLRSSAGKEFLGHGRRSARECKI